MDSINTQMDEALSEVNAFEVSDDAETCQKNLDDISEKISVVSGMVDSVPDANVRDAFRAKLDEISARREEFLIELNKLRNSDEVASSRG